MPPLRPSGLRLAFALVAAILLHAALVAALLRSPGRGKQRLSSPSHPGGLLSIELRSPPPVRSARPGPPLRPPVAPTPRPHPRPQVSARSLPPPPAPTQPLTPTRPLTPSSPNWLAAEGLAPAPRSRFGPGWGLSTTLRDPGATLAPPPVAAPGGPALAPGLPVRPAGREEALREEALVEEKTRVEQRIQGWIAEAQGKERAGAGRDAYWQTLQDHLERGFAPTWELLDRGDRGAGAPGAVGAAVDQYLGQAGDYGRTGSPLGGQVGSRVGRAPLGEELGSLAAEDRGLRGTPLERPSAGLSLEALGRAAFGEGTRWHTRLVVRVLLGQRADGGVDSAEVAATSGNAAFDLLALGQVRGLGQAGLLGPPPGRLRRTLWAFEADFLQFPPLPIAGCSFDLILPAECFYPLKKKVKAAVRLERAD